MSLPSFTVIGNLSDILPAPTDGELSTVAWQTARVSFAHNITTGVLVYDGRIYNRPPTVTVTPAADGGITNVLLANDAGLNVDGVQWQVRIVVSNTTVASWCIDAPADGEIIDLAAAPHADAVPVGTTAQQLAAAIAAYMAEHPGGAVSWDDVLSKPSTFPPATHTHSAGDVTGLTAVATTGAYGDLTGKPTLGTAAATDASAYAPAVHTHTAAAITDGVRTVAVATGTETRPTTSGVVLWIGGTTEPTNMGVGDIWLKAT